MTEKQKTDLSPNPSRRDALKTIGIGIGASTLLSPLNSCYDAKEIRAPASQLKDPIYYSSATAIAEAIKSKKISSEEVTKAFLDRINEVNPKINAVVQLTEEQALLSARKADNDLADGENFGPLHGVPITIKDSFDTVGIISTAGTLGRSNYIPKKDAAVVQRLKQAGAIVMGKTNTPELTLAGETDNLVYGRTNNPYDLSRIPGGSSGGAAAIVSVGGAAFDVGTDTGGSIRNPAHCCGLCGLKPTSGRVPRTGHIISYLGYDQALTTAGPITRHVEDLIKILPIISGSDGTDPYIYDLPFGDPNKVTVSELKYAFYSDIGGITADPEVNQMMRNIVGELTNENTDIEEAQPGIIEETTELFFEILGVDKGCGANRILAAAGTEKISPLLEWARAPEEGFATPSISPIQFVDHFEKWAMFNSTMTSFYKDHDIILCPASSMAAPVHGFKELAMNTLSYTATYNMTGWPVAVVRAGASSSGLPIGIQIVGKPWQEHKVLAVAKYVEETFGGFQPPDI
jgi:amidase